MLYGIELHANTFPTYINKLVKLNNSIVQIVINQSPFGSINELYVSFNTLSISEMHNR